MKTGLTEIVLILDRSTSMSSIILESINGLNEFMDQQKMEDGEANVSITMFDRNVEFVKDCVPLTEIEHFTLNDYRPQGTTALYDAIGSTMVRVGERLAETDESERPEKVMVVILTDGANNEFYTYDAEKVKEMIGHQEEKYDWEFMFLAANQDAFLVGEKFGMQSHNSISYSHTDSGARCAFANATAYTKSYRSVSKSVAKDELRSYRAISEDEIS